ncbi:MULTISPECIES: enolase C-terminal domain-like protein [Amycolatopsis]|uniref:L-alanine-DL-glutamate epimerase n=2 Tax=Amycolatopsis TaxID=1813 RepID=A0A1I3WIJ3_9PSEU|nr:enolase C-terminal domain-like protein [Amycolatopsis sacchari]SFK07514.1 L-alanine-DL-glutamate epimerase [Amycolatopsis sacchari]
MSTTNLPDPVIRYENGRTDVEALAAALRERVDGEVRFDRGSRAAYSTDASNFRQVPIGVVVPRTPEAAAEAVAVAREHGAPVLSRGGGTSLAGQCTNTALVLDWSKYCHRLESVDAAARTCVVQPGIVLDELNRRLAPTGLRFGPEPATHPNCTLGGMIGNNSCGATAQRTGKVVDNIAALEVLCYDGTRFWCGPTTDEEYAEIERRGDPKAAIYRQLRALRDRYADEVRARFPDIPRRVSGYNLDSLLPEHGFDVAGLLVGSESTLVTVLRAELKLVPVVRERTLVVLGYPSVDRAADAVPSILPHEPIALEGLDAKLIRDERIKHLNPRALRELPEGKAFLMVQFGGDTTDEADERAHRMLAALHDTEHDPAVSFLDDPDREHELWQVREAGLGATAHVPDRPDTFEGWEDSAVPPERLGDYLRRLQRLYEEFGYASDTGPALYGHFGQGCVHTRIPFDLYTAVVVVHVLAGGETGLGWTYADAAVADVVTGVLAPVVKGQEVLDVPARWEAMRRRIRNLGRPGIVSCALSAVDIALWDAAARVAGLSLSRLLGRVRDEVELYGSGGFTSESVPQLRARLDGWVHRQGIPRVKIKIGEAWGGEPERDLARVRAARSVIGHDAELYVDANGGYSIGQARRIARRLEDHDVRWFEEPVSSDDLAGLAELRAKTTMDVAAGEYGYDLPYFARMVPAVDCLQIDVTRCGGYTEWRRAAAVAAAANREVSAHCAPNLSAHVAAATPNFRHLEWFADHDRIESRFFDGALDPACGRVAPDPGVPGHGLTLKPDIEAFAVG